MKASLLIPAFVTIIVIRAAIVCGAPPNAAPAPTATSQPAAPSSLSELLQKGIYTEETVGDVDAAMKIYEQVLGKAKSVRKFAAQAQYRLGLCLLKKQKKTEAQAAFEKLIKDYPEEKELVAKARKHAPDEFVIGPVPWTSGEVLPLAIKLPSGLEIGTFNYTADSVKDGSRDAWRVQIRRFVLAGGNNQGISRVIADGETFRPIRSLFKHTILGNVEGVYRPNEVEVTTKSNGKSTTKKRELESPVYDNEQAMHLMRRLPLAVGYKTTMPVYVTFGAGPLPVGLEVTAVETAEVPAGKFECYKIELSIKQTMWYSTDRHRYIVKFEAEGVTAELAAILQLKPGEPNKYQNEELGLSLTAPAGWFFYKPKMPKKSDETLFLLDPDAEAMSMVEVKPLDTLKSEHKASVRAWAESELAEAKEGLKDFKVRTDSWKERKVAGHPALSVLAEFTDAKRKMVGYNTFLFSKSRAVLLRTQTDLDGFETFRPGFDAIIESCKVK